MSSDRETLVSVRGLGKRYRIGAQQERARTLRDRITQAAQSIGRKKTAADPREFWALRDVSFDLARGEVLGIIGRNGAGKSTLLKILSQITEPSEGEVHLHGRVSSLLEVGVGFHPELSGRENVFLNGAILGMTRAEIRRKFDEIVAFSEVERFIDTPVKRYSSGMYVRLAFAVAAHLEPDILIVDEVLAVGDSSFQRKCLGKMEEVASSNRGVLVVSHNMAVVTQLCDRTLWIDRGSIVTTGETASVVGRYLSQGVADQVEWRPSSRASEAFEYLGVHLRAAGSQGGSAIPADKPIDIVFDFVVGEHLKPGFLAFRINRDDGLAILTSSSTDDQSTVNESWRAGRQRLRCRIPGHLLAPAKYLVSVAEPGPRSNVVHEGVLTFTITDQNSLIARDRREGIIAPRLVWEEEPL